MSQVLDLRKKKKEPEPEAKTVPTREREKPDKISGQVDWSKYPTDKRLIFTTVTILVMVGAAYLYLQKNIITATFFILIATVTLILSAKKKRVAYWEINQSGVIFDQSIFPYQDLKSFWIEYQPGYIKELSLKSRKWYLGYVKIPLEQENPLLVRSCLIEHLPEERHEDTLIELITRKLGI